MLDKKKRLLLKTLLGVGIGALAWPFVQHLPLLRRSSTKIQMHGTSPEIAHHILRKDFPSPSSTVHHDVVIIGSGVAGLSAARYLNRNGIKDFSILELEAIVGGNSAWGENILTQYPWAAHYLPIPSEQSDFLYEFLKEENIITGFNAKGDPFYNELYLCHDLQERLYLNGLWQEGLVPENGLTSKDKAEITRFLALMKAYKYAKGKDDRFAFSIPLAFSSQDEHYLKLDTISMAQFLKDQNFHSPYLLWYINYCCRDDYGAGIDVISAWAGIHYFASRRAKSANSAPDAILTWPQGNGFLVQRLAKDFLAQITTHALVYELSPLQEKFSVKYFDPIQQQSTEIIAKAVIIAIPRFIGKVICHNDFQQNFKGIDQFEYSPWLVANLHLKSLPKSEGAPLAWDNVSFYSESVGYVSALHQSLKVHKEGMLTYYLPLDKESPAEARKKALARSPEDWKKMIQHDLRSFHPDLDDHLEHIDARVFGHAMIRPATNLIWGKARTSLKRGQNGLFFAHSDMSGISLFEEAFWQGLTTAQEVVKYL